ncbi:MAG: sigma-70 family RNA polymerase sigma factor [Alphaproteobacteria bacterium]|nr:sigma-70 family RNA polymerase sigma factor [Alphaproteobacteria bacterium]
MAGPEITMLLKRASRGDATAQNDLAPLVYDELKIRADALMRRESDAQSLQATVLVNDAFMRLIDAAAVDWESRTHFYALASRVMRRVLVEHARDRGRLKRGGRVRKVELDEAITICPTRDEDVLALEEALVRLAEVDPRQADFVTMRFFGGMSMEAIAESLGVPKRTLEREWTLVKAWLRRELAS